MTQSKSTAKAYERVEWFSRTNGQQTSTRANGTPVKQRAEEILHYGIPDDPRPMSELYREAFEMFGRLSEANSPVGEENDPMFSFDEVPDLDALAQAQGVPPVQDIGALAIDSWPDDESPDDFMAAVQRWRRE